MSELEHGTSVVDWFDTTWYYLRVTKSSKTHVVLVDLLNDVVSRETRWGSQRLRPSDLLRLQGRKFGTRPVPYMLV